MKNFILAFFGTFLIILNTNAGFEYYGNEEVIEGKCIINEQVNEEGKLLYGAHYIVNNLYFDFNNEQFGKDCLINNAKITIKWTSKYSFIILDKTIPKINSNDINPDILHYDEKDNFIITNKIINSTIENIETKEVGELESLINVNNKEAKFNTFLSIDKLSYSEKENYIKNNKEAVYQELYEILNILNTDVQYYEIDKERSYTETDIFTDKTQMIELYK